MKISYFFHISLNIGRSDMKQKAKDLCDPCFHIHSLLFGFSHILFFFVLPLCLAALLIFSLWPTQASIAFKDSNIYTTVYFYIEKTQNVHFFWLLI